MFPGKFKHLTSNSGVCFHVFSHILQPLFLSQSVADGTFSSVLVSLCSLGFGSLPCPLGGFCIPFHVLYWFSPFDLICLRRRLTADSNCWASTSCSTTNSTCGSSRLDRKRSAEPYSRDVFYCDLKKRCGPSHCDATGCQFASYQFIAHQVNVNPALATNNATLEAVIPPVVQEALYIAIECFEKQKVIRGPLSPLHTCKEFQVIYEEYSSSKWYVCFVYLFLFVSVCLLSQFL